MKEAIRTIALSLICAGAFAHVAAREADNWAVLDEDAGWRNVFYNAPGQPLDSLEPISVVMTGQKDADGYPIGDIYYNESKSCYGIYRYYPSFVSGVRGIGYGTSTGSNNPVVLYTHPVYNKKTGGYDYGWINYDEGFISSIAGWLDASKTSFTAGCGAKKIGTFREILEMATSKGYYRARLAIDRQLYSSTLYTTDADIHGYASPIWGFHNDSIRLGRAYYYLYLSEPMKHLGYSCEGYNCPATKGTYYFDQDNTTYSFDFHVHIPYYAPTFVVSQYRQWSRSSDGSYKPGRWTDKYSYFCASHEYGYSAYEDCSSYYSSTVKRSEVVQNGDSLVEFRLAGATRVVTGASEAGAHAMNIYDTSYSDIIKLVPKYKLSVQSGNHGYFYGSSGCSTEEGVGKKCTYAVEASNGYEFYCWSNKESSASCVSFVNPLELSVRVDTTLYAFWTAKSLKVVNRTDSLNEARYNKKYGAYQHVFGHDSLAFFANISGTNQDAYFGCQYYDDSTGWQFIDSVKTVPGGELAAEKSVSLKIGRTGEATCTYNGIATLGTKKFSKVNETRFRFAVSYDKEFPSKRVAFSQEKKVQWLHQVVFLDLYHKVISDTALVYGSTVKFPTDRELLRIPADSNGIHFGYYWDDQDRKEYSSKTDSITLEKDSLRMRSWLLESFDVKFFDIDGTVLKDTIVKKNGYSKAPATPYHAGLRFKGWEADTGYCDDDGAYAVVSPVNVTATYEAKDTPVYEFTVDGLEPGSMAYAINVKTPNKCFNVSNKAFLQQEDGDMVEIITLKPGRANLLKMDVSVSNVDDCANDSLANIWRLYIEDTTKNVTYMVNGETYQPASTSEKQVFYSFTTAGEPESSSSAEAKSSSSSAKSSSSSAKPQSSSSAKAKSSSSSAKAKSSSSKKSGKSSSSKGGKNAIAAAGQVPQFTLFAIDRSLLVTGARVGSAYAVLDMQGRVMMSGRVDVANFGLAIDRAGTYLVRIGSQTQRVKIK